MSGVRPGLDWGPVVQAIQAGRRFVVLTHSNPDGDAIGSSVAVARHLAAAGREVAILVPTVVEARYDFLLQDAPLAVYEPRLHEATLFGADTILVLDTNQWSLLGSLARPLERAGGTRIVVDHHGGQSQLGDITVIDTEASSTGELIHELLLVLGAPIDAAMAQCLFTAMATDTGWFRFQRAGPNVFRAAALLLERGVQAYSIYKRIFERRSWADLRQISSHLDKIEPKLSGRAAFVLMNLAAYESLSGEGMVVESLLDLGLSVEEVEVCALLREIGPGRIKVSLRSKGRIDVRKVALLLGGGGHHNAAGAVIEGSTLEATAGRLERALAPSLA